MVEVFFGLIAILTGMIGWVWMDQNNRTKGIEKGLTEVRDLVQETALVNERGHSSIGERLARMEAKLPNGEAKQALSMIAEIREMLKQHPAAIMPARKRK